MANGKEIRLGGILVPGPRAWALGPAGREVRFRKSSGD